jgi:SAM-dependent methyltransferase
MGLNTHGVGKMGSEKEAWLSIIEPEDLDVHLANLKQAQANAQIIKDFFKKCPMKEGSKLLIHGCGTCQMFDYIRPSDIGKMDITFADINPKMLEAAKRRLKKYEIPYKLLIDDIENTGIREHYDGILLGLVLLHIDWRKSLENMIKLTPLFYIIEQEQEFSKPSITPGRKLPPSIQKYAKVEAVKLVPRKELTEFMKENDYKLIYTIEKPVPDNKKMVGLVYAKQS